MKKGYFKRKIMFLCIITMFMITLMGCSSKKDGEVFEEYKKAWINQDFKVMYNMISKESKEKISEEKFLDRYNKIYSSIGVNNLKIENPKDQISKNKEFSFKVSMDTIGGKIEGNDIKLTIVEEDKENKILWNEGLILPQMGSGDEVSVNISEYKGKRGNIYDRNGKLLAGEQDIKSINIYPKDFEENKEEKIAQVAQILDISETYIQEKIDKNTNPEHIIHLVNLLDSESDKISQLIEIKGIRIPTTKGRVYVGGEALGSLIGYTKEITAEQLIKNKEKGYSSTSKIGVKGIEQVYEDQLRAIDGGKVSIKKSTGEEIVLAERKPKDGQDIKLAIDMELQQKIYEEINKGKEEKGASIALDPKTGEVLAMVSSPSFDSNTYTTYLTKSEKQRREARNGSETLNRANNSYSPGSTMKLVTAATGIDSKSIDPNKAIDIKGSTWEEYKITRVKDPGKPVNLKDATKYSDNIYFAKIGLEMGEKTFIDGAKKFGIGEKLQFDYPMDKSQISNDGKLDKKALLADSSYGQGEVLTTPLDVALMYSALGNDGKIMAPRLDISKNTEAKVYKEAINKENIPMLVDIFSSVVNDSDGTGNDAKINGFNIAAKTGTAEIKKSKDDTNGTENGWFVGVNTDNPRISVSMIIEDVKDRGGSHVVSPKVKNIMEYYLNK